MLSKRTDLKICALFLLIVLAIPAEVWYNKSAKNLGVSRFCRFSGPQRGGLGRPRSLVSRLNGVQEAAGSNPVTRTTKSPETAGFQDFFISISHMVSLTGIKYPVCTAPSFARPVLSACLQNGFVL